MYIILEGKQRSICQNSKNSSAYDTCNKNRFSKKKKEIKKRKELYKKKKKNKNVKPDDNRYTRHICA